jgi:hypothetical protein
MRLLVAQLKKELRKRGPGTQGRMSDLQDCLKEGILLNVPVASGMRPAATTAWQGWM